MALVLADRVKETTTTTGTGTLTLAGAATGFQSFSVVGNGNTTYYAISSSGGSQFEIGIGTYTASGTTLARTTILASSNSGSAVDLSAGTKDVFVVYPASKSVNLDGSGNATALGTVASATLTNATGLPVSTGISGLGANVATWLATPTSANLISVVSDETGSGSLVFATSPTLVTPNLGTPSTLVGTNITGTATSFTASNVTTNANLTGAVTSVGNATSLGSFSSANLLSALTDETGTGVNVFATSPTLVTPLLGTPTSGTLSNCTVDGTDSVGFRNIPINSQSAAYTAVLADSGKVIFHPSTDANARTFTIPANGSVAYPIGTALTFINMTSQVVTIAITTDTMYLSSAGTTGSRSLAQYGSATAIKMTSTTWLISGSGLT